VTDTVAKPDATYIEHIRGVDVLLHECAITDSLIEIEKRGLHSRTTNVASLAANASVGRLILTHISPGLIPDLEIAREIFPATEMARDGMEIEF
jgi:ribonuclease Z